MKNLTLNILLIFWAAVSTAGVPTTQLTETDAIRWDFYINSAPWLPNRFPCLKSPGSPTSD